MCMKARRITIVILLIFAPFIYYHTVFSSHSFSATSELKSIKFHKVSVKNIVAYSLEKQIALQEQEIWCPEKIKLSTTGQQIDDKWKQIPGTFIYIYSAYEDDRLKPHYYIRIIAMSKGAWEKKLFCHLKLNSGVVHVVRANTTHMWLPEWDPIDAETYEPILINCKLPVAINVTQIQQVAVTTKPCSSTSLVIHLWKGSHNINTSKKHFHIVLCVKPVQFLEDMSIKLISWIEINRMLGADKIEIYVSDVHPQTYKLLEWYQKSSNVYIHNYTSITDREAGVWQKRREEMIAYNDCLYRNVHTSRFVLPVDIDEIIVPRRDYTWRQLLSRLFASQPDLLNNYASFSARNAYFMDQFTSNTDRLLEPITILRNLRRSEFSPDGESGKSFIWTGNTLVVFNHYTLKSLRPGIHNVFFMPVELVQMNHYKNSCSALLLPECIKYLFYSPRIYDPIINKYRNELVKRIYDVYNILNL